ncbi:hypothetical protein CUZ89_0680 [Enterococcus xinjiangensis]|nr:hypothetical protein [Enterococcus lactis]MBL4992503.1 hypothetical protein [Enterococcus lactis]MBL5002499.1 hypothetical protein [Enterococcus lactis]
MVWDQGVAGSNPVFPIFFYLAFCFQMIYNFFKLNMRP